MQAIDFSSIYFQFSLRKVIAQKENSKLFTLDQIVQFHNCSLIYPIFGKLLFSSPKWNFSDNFYFVHAPPP